MEITGPIGIRKEYLSSKNGAEGKTMHKLFGIRKENLKSKQREGERTMFKALGMRWLVVAAGEVDPILWTGIGAS